MNIHQNVTLRLRIATTLAAMCLAPRASTAQHASRQSQPDRQTVTTERGLFAETAQRIAAGDTTLLDGTYELKYRDKTIERGRYAHGRRVGEWEFRNYHDWVELRYDYSHGRPTYILPHKGKTYNQETYPCTYLGSPIVPYLFVVSNVHYPQTEWDNKRGGEATLTLRIDAQGRMAGYEIRKPSSPHFAKAVRYAAEKIPRDEWRWVPARSKGRAVAGEYDIVIYFDN